MGEERDQVGVAVGPLPQDDRLADPLVLHYQLHHDRPLPLGYGAGVLATFLKRCACSVRSSRSAFLIRCFAL